MGDRHVPVEPLGWLDDGKEDRSSLADDGLAARWADVSEENADDWDSRNWHRGPAGQRDGW